MEKTADLLTAMDKPAWQTAELSEEWVDQSNSGALHSAHHPPTTTTTRHASRLTTTSHAHSTSSPRHSSPSIIVNGHLSPDPTPPWLRAAVDGMVNDVLGRRPGPLQKIFQPARSPPAARPRPRSPPVGHHIRIRSESSPSASSADVSPRISDGLPTKETFDFAVPRCHAPWRSLPHFSASETSSDQSSASSRLDSANPQACLEPVALAAPAFFPRRQPRLGDFEVIDEVSEEPSLDGLVRDYTSGSLPSLDQPPSLPFAQQTPLPRPPDAAPIPDPPTQPPSSSSRPDPTAESGEPRIFHFTYDTFARKHLTRLVEEIDGFSSARSLSLPHHTSPKIHALLGSPGELPSSNVSRSISRGLAHSTPPLSTLHAGHTPFRPVASFSQRVREEDAWRASFCKPSVYAVKSVQGPGHDFSANLEDDEEVVFEPQRKFSATAPPVTRSSKRIRLTSLKDSVVVANERRCKKRFSAAATLPAAPHAGLAATVEAPTEVKVPPRDRLAEARALMEKIRAKTNVVAPVCVLSEDLIDEERFVTPRPRNPTPLTATRGPCQRNHAPEDLESMVAHQSVSTVLLTERQTDELDDIRASSEAPAQWAELANGRDQPGSISEHEESLVRRTLIEEDEDDEDFEWSLAQPPQSSNHCSPQAGAAGPDPIQQRLASAAAASLRQALLDSTAVPPSSNGSRKPSPFGSGRSSVTSISGSSRRHFATQPALPQSQAAPELLRKPKQHGLMTIAPADVEELLLDQQRVGGMVFDAARGRWMRCGSSEKKEQEEVEAQEEADEEDVFKDIESLTSRVTPRSGSAATNGNDPEMLSPISRPKSVLKASPPGPLRPVLDAEASPMPKANRSVSFQDGRKNGKIIGLDHPLPQPQLEHPEPVSARTRRIGAALDDLIAVGENSIVSTRAKKVRPKARKTSSSSLLTGNHTASFGGTLTMASSSEECSFGISRDRLLKLITDIEPFEPLWDQLKVICLAGKRIESVVRIDELLPKLDQVDLQANEISFLTGLPSSVRMLLVARNKLTDLASFGHLINLERLDVSRNGLTSLGQLAGLRHLRELKAEENQICDLEGLAGLDGLTKVSLKGNKLKKVRLEGYAWGRLEVLNLSRNQIDEISGLDQLISVYSLNLDHNNLYTLAVLESMPNLRVLRISDNHLEQVDVSNWANLRTLYVDQNDLLEIVGADRLRKLENLSARDQHGGELSLPMNQIRDVKRLYLGGNPIPSAFPSQRFYNLVYLELAMCQCRTLPHDLASVIPNVRSVNLNYNFLTELSPLAGLSRLEKLTIVGSRIKEFGRGLISVLESLPELELLDLRMNPFNSAFYAPLVADGQGGGTSRMSEYEIIASIPRPNFKLVEEKHRKEHNWRSIDERFKKSLPNQYYLRRTTYRALVIITSLHLKSLDGLLINDSERKKMGKFLRGLGRKI